MKDKDNEEKYVVTPKGLFALALTRLNLVENVTDWRTDAAWAVFETMMKEQGYIVDEDDGK